MSGDHAILAPSSAGQWVRCPASVLMQRQFPTEEDSEAAREGTLAHAMFADLLLQRVWSAGYDTDILDYITPMADHVDATSKPGSRWVEQRLEMPGVHPDMWGTADVAAFDLDARTLKVYDLKYGWGIVNDYENWQLIAYAAGAFEKLNLDAVVEWSVELHILQPRPYHRNGPIRVWALSYPHFSNLVRRLRSAAEEAMSNNPLAHPGPYCKHCTARHACKALQAAALDVIDASSDSTPVQLPPAALGRELALLRHHLERLQARETGLAAQVEHHIRAGAAVPGWGLETTPGREDWTRPVEEVLTLGALYNVALSKPGAITPNQARKAGIPAEVIAAYAQRKPGTAKLVQVTTEDARRAFGGES